MSTNPMNTNFDKLRNSRDFLSHLLDLTPSTAMDLLANGGEEVVTQMNEALGMEAFQTGDSVLASPSNATNEFIGTVVKVRYSKEDDKILFTVTDQDGQSFDCESSELIPNLND